MPLSRVAIASQLAWLPENASGAAAAWPGVPAGYGAYLKLLLPLGIDSSVPIAGYSFACSTVAALNARAAFWNNYGIVAGQPTASRLQPITHREVAATLGLPYDADFGRAAISRAYGGHWPPHLGSSALLTEAFAQQLAQLLGPATGAYFYGSPEEGNYSWDASGSPVSWLEMGTLADLPAVYRRDGAFPTYVFAADHSWCLYQAEDEEWLAFGGTVDLADVLLAQQDLETFRLTH
jgi:hypothetical protein